MTEKTNQSGDESCNSYGGLRAIHLNKTCLGLVNAMMLAGAAHGQQSPSTNTPPAQLPDVVVSGEQESYNPERLENPRYTEPLRDIPQTVTVIPQAVIQQQNATTLRDVLRNVPGISMQAGEGGGGLAGDNLTIRGFNARSDIFVDGVRDYGSYSRDPFNIEQVEVVKGPTSATAGRGAAGGAINTVTKRPTLRQMYGGSLGGGTDNYKRFSLDVNQPLTEAGLETTSLRLNALYHENDTPGRDEITNERWGVAPAVTFGLGTPTRFTLLYQHMTQNNVPDYGVPWVPANTHPFLSQFSNAAPPIDYSNFYGLSDYDFEDIQNDIATAILEHDFNESFQMRNLLRYGRTYRDSAITAPRFVDVNTSTAIRRQLQRREMEHSIIANYTDFNWNAQTGPVEHAIVTGLEVSREEQDNRNSADATNQPVTDLFNPNPNDLPLGPMLPIAAPWTEGQADTLALHLSDTAKLTDHWDLIGGLRYDHIETDFTGTTGRTDDLLSWRSGIVFKPAENGSIYFGYGTSFTPSLEGNTGISGAILNVDPEQTRIFELGTKWDFFEERLSLSGAVFRTEKTDARTPEIGGTGNTVLDGEQRVDGFELGAAGSITRDWRVFAGYTYLDGQVERSNTPAEVGRTLMNTPKHSVSLWTTYNIASKVELGGGAQFVGDRLSANNPNARTAPDYWVFDAMAAYNVNKNITLRLNVYNLADKEYIDRVGGGHFVPGAGRSAVLSANFAF